MSETAAMTITDAQRLRESLLVYEGTDYDLTDEQLAVYAEAARVSVRRSGRRQSWTALAAGSIYLALPDGEP